MDRMATKRSQVADALGEMDRLGGLTAGQVMTDAPSCIRPETSALDVVRLFHAHGFRHLLVTDAKDRLAGVISDRDVLRCLGPEKRPVRETLAGITAASIMSGDVITIRPDTPLEKAIVLLIEHGISCLPVCEGGTLRGILTNTDLHVVLQVMLETIRQPDPEETMVPTAASPRR